MGTIRTRRVAPPWGYASIEACYRSGLSSPTRSSSLSFSLLPQAQQHPCLPPWPSYLPPLASWLLPHHPQPKCSIAPHLQDYNVGSYQHASHDYRVSALPIFLSCCGLNASTSRDKNGLALLLLPALILTSNVLTSLWIQFCPHNTKDRCPRLQTCRPDEPKLQGPSFVPARSPRSFPTV